MHRCINNQILELEIKGAPDLGSHLQLSLILHVERHVHGQVLLKVNFSSVNDNQVQIASSYLLDVSLDLYLLGAFWKELFAITASINLALLDSYPLLENICVPEVGIDCVLVNPRLLGIHIRDLGRPTMILFD